MFAGPYAKYYDLINSDKHYREEIELVYVWADKPRTILDIGCGTANYWKYFPEGTELTGIEPNSDMIPKKKNIFHGTVRELAQAFAPFDCAIAIFNVVNYSQSLDWFDIIPLKSGGHFVFDIYDTKKIEKDGFRQTSKLINGLERVITPTETTKEYVNLEVELKCKGKSYKEFHRLYLYSHEQILEQSKINYTIEKICGYTTKWQTWYNLVRK